MRVETGICQRWWRLIGWHVFFPFFQETHRPMADDFGRSRETPAKGTKKKRKKRAPPIFLPSLLRNSKARYLWWFDLVWRSIVGVFRLFPPAQLGGAKTRQRRTLAGFSRCGWLLIADLITHAFHVRHNRLVPSFTVFFFSFTHFVTEFDWVSDPALGKQKKKKIEHKTRPGKRRHGRRKQKGGRPQKKKGK